MNNRATRQETVELRSTMAGDKIVCPTNVEKLIHNGLPLSC